MDGTGAHRDNQLRAISSVSRLSGPIPSHRYFRLSQSHLCPFQICTWRNDTRYVPTEMVELHTIKRREWYVWQTARQFSPPRTLGT